MLNHNFEFTDRKDYFCQGIFEYVSGSRNLPNWTQGTINGIKCVLWWYDGLSFQVNSKKELICICDKELPLEKLAFIVEEKLIGYFSPSNCKLQEYKFPKF